ncbi:MAG TPA: hypothetical protein VJX66_19175 [Amycolatopsis sp.]|nr:hypothetical protein [Amycolatopsis sp.]
MSTVHESAVDLPAVVQDLERLSLELRAEHRWRIPEVSGACDALACAAVLLRTQGDGENPTDLLYDAIALARSTVETTKFAARERTGDRI